MLRRRRTAFALLTACAGIVIGLSAMAIGITVEYLRKDAIRAAERESTNATLAVGDHLMRVIGPLDGLLSELRDVVPSLGIATPAEFGAFFSGELQRQFLGDRLRREGHAGVLAIVAADGTVIQASPEAARPELSVIVEEHLRRSDRTGGYGLMASPPVASRAAGQPMIYLGRRVAGSLGSHVGIVVIGLPAASLDRFYDGFPALPGQSFVISRADGTLLANRPELTQILGPSMPEGSAWYDTVAQGGGTYRVPAGNGRGDNIIVAVHLIPDTPFVVSSGMLESSALAEWRSHAVRIGAGALLAFVCAIGLLWALKWQFDRVFASEKSLVEREARLEEQSAELAQVAARLDAAVNNMSHGLCMYDADGRLVVCNAPYRQMYRLSAEDAQPGTTIAQLLERRIAVGTFQGDPQARIAEVHSAVLEGHAGWFITELADERVIAMTVSPLAGGGFVSVHEDITERTRAETRIAHLARHDPLTDLPNRLLFRERMDEAIARLDHTGRGFAAFIFDIDLFKSVNDTLGHSGGDALLKAVAGRLRTCIGAADTVGRIGGDEFAVIQIADADPQEAATLLAQRLLEELRAPYEIQGKQIVIGISIGIAVAPRDGRELSRILRNADLALYRAKGDGRGCWRFFEPAMDADLRLQREFEFRLREALPRQEFEIHYQPIVDLGTYRPCTVEALVRWRHPELGLIPPDKFIPVAEETGLIIPLGEWILDAACHTGATWPDHVRLAVNLSAIQFRSGNLVDAVRGALARSGLPAARLELEITESVLLQKDHGTLAVLHELAGLGVHIVLDDFGTGYSSLSYLQLFPFSKIKIDKSFVADLSSRTDCAAIVSTVTNLAKALDMGTTAEGVETWEQVTLLRAVGCREAQGWLFGRPVPAVALCFEAAPFRAEAAA
ncbi:EAL domain-containing protein [Rhodoplanes sp. TEM]|uniref:EAL domain-containing protein n=1 Tax=Rhodoplanes tepidamans TaxID=200616 RepID=A0ABT5J7C6_RHOTP|nr:MULTISPECIES: EAL domain-containing protein [Rhodoplanes]MDC7785418.1 EAL domain-containing protein [Rhodoplanes tepidamans]MDC7986953.1 EAL domain-containing protein [Rhodoplanes sp. TEM]MDQ0353129.1 diguanylate cyclase (GGDEF)-like protein [Rhodoplanes tepidamans]